MVLSLGLRVQLCLVLFIMCIYQFECLLCPKIMGIAQNRARFQQPTNFLQGNRIAARPFVPTQARLHTTFLKSSPQRVEKTVIKRGTVITSDTREGEGGVLLYALAHYAVL